MHRLAKAGFSKEFVQRAILPEWWDEQCSDDQRLVRDIEIRVARFLGRSVAAVGDPQRTLAPSQYSGAQLRRVRDTSRDRLAPAMHAAIRVTTAVVRNLRDAVPPPHKLPPSGLTWRDQCADNGIAPTLKAIVASLWAHGIPVVTLDLLPTPSFQGMACVIEDRPVIVVGHKHDEPGRVAFTIAHEAGHIAAGHCMVDQPVVDEGDEIVDETEMERVADRYATDVLLGDTSVPPVTDAGSTNFKGWARLAAAVEHKTGADASFVIYSWARETGDYATAAMAVKALYRSSGARKQLRELFSLHVDFTVATETERGLLLCADGASALNEAAR